MANNHNKILNAAARKELKPLGLKRKGSSRTWIDDHGWWVIQVEFQPSSRSKGSYLNVGVSWLLYENAHLGFDVGYRTDAPFIEYKTDDQFEVAARTMAQRAADEVVKFRNDFKSLRSAAMHYQREELAVPWGYYYAGVIFGLAGMVSKSREHLGRVATMDEENEWQKGLAYKARDLLQLLEDANQFTQSMTGTVYRARSAANLDDWDDALSF